MSTEFLSEYSAKLFTNYAKLLLPIYLNISEGTAVSRRKFAQSTLESLFTILVKG